MLCENQSIPIEKELKNEIYIIMDYLGKTYIHGYKFVQLTWCNQVSKYNT